MPFSSGEQAALINKKVLVVDLDGTLYSINTFHHFLGFIITYNLRKFKMDEENDPIIIDIGSGHLKAGFASDDGPKNMIPMIVGKPVNKGALVGMD